MNLVTTWFRLLQAAKELCDQIADEGDHGDGAYDDGCPICIAHADLRAAITAATDPSLVGRE